MRQSATCLRPSLGALGVGETKLAKEGGISWFLFEFNGVLMGFYGILWDFVELNGISLN